MAIMVLRQRGPEPLSDAVADEIQNHPELQVLDRSSKMLRVEGEAHHLKTIVEQHPGLEMSEEAFYRQIDPARQTAKPPR
jgi:hypothetical protein